MSDDFNSEKKNIFERPELYCFGFMVVIVLGVVHFSKTKDSYLPSKEKLQQIEVVKQAHKGFLNKLTVNECYATNVVQEIENSPIQNNTRYRVKAINYVVKDGKYFRLQNYAVLSNYNVQYFNSNVEYKCLKGGYDYSTQYYFKSRDFKELSDFTQIELGPKLSAMTANKTLKQDIFNKCFNGKTIVFGKLCEN